MQQHMGNGSNAAMLQSASLRWRNRCLACDDDRYSEPFTLFIVLTNAASVSSRRLCDPGACLIQFWG